ncbi:discoidin domain-containing protein [Actinoalloteichus caeruleus]|uniref:discoidin domain-containing protein n=1 Tax=Actinoalloteichus cyanogriseus TaxID=2893586 RepID=UPI003BB8F54C
MEDTDLVVPIEVHALLVNYKVRKFQTFERWSPSLFLMLHEDYRASGEPPPYQNRQDVTNDPGFEGVHVQWRLPEALTDGFVHPDTGQSQFPLVPNRWLVVRYHSLNGRRQATGWVVHGDYLESRDTATPAKQGSNPYLDPHASAPTLDHLGRAHPLADGAWREPTPPTPPFLTAVGPGLPAFAAFEPYHQNVFAFHDTLDDLRPTPHSPAPDTDLSYAVIGWYSDDQADILVHARNNAIPGLLPENIPNPDINTVLDALGWTCPGEVSRVVRTRYAGTALPIPWQREGDHPPSERPDPAGIKVAVGHSIADAAAAMAAQQTRSARTGEVVNALFQGKLHELDTADGPIDLAELTHQSWFSRREGGHVWQVVSRPSEQRDPQQPPPPQPPWVDQLNADQAAYDAALPMLTAAQWRLWTLWWLRNLPPNQRPHGYTWDDKVWQKKIDELRASVAARRKEVADLAGRIPHAGDPEALDRATAQFAHHHQLPETLELTRSTRRDYYRPTDPVLVLSNTGTTDPLGRDGDDPLLCRTPSTLLTKVKINNKWVGPEKSAPVPTLDGLPEVCSALLAEFAMLDTAARTPAAGGTTALHGIVAHPETHTAGGFPEYTRVWRQPWQPMYLQWKIKYCATPYQTGTSAHWDFDGDRYRWQGTGAAAGDGEGGRRWTVFAGQSFLTPAFTYVLREQLRRELATAPAATAAGLESLRERLHDLRILSQTLDGFHDWLLHHDGTARLTTDPTILSMVGESNHVPDGAGDPRQHRFQPVRAGQFYVTDLRIIDRFGQVLRKVAPEQSQPTQFTPIRAASVTPDAPPFDAAPGPQRFLQVPPRLLHNARLAFDPLPAQGGDTPATSTPVAGWLLVNHLDQTLLVYAPDGEALGELRVVTTVTGTKTTRATAWNALPHAPYRHPSQPEFAAAHPDLAGFATALLGHPHGAFTDLMNTIDQALDHIGDPSPVEDRNPTRLLGRPVALLRASLGIELLGPALTDSTWDRVLTPPAPDYTDHRWTVRLGDPDRLADGLIGYFAATEPGHPTDYRRLHAVDPVSGTGGYVVPIGTGAGLRVPARPADSPVTHHLTLLACPHTTVHATTDILPVTGLTLDADLTHQALSRIRASFRLNPVLASTRADHITVTTSLGHTPGHPPTAMIDGTLSSFYWSEKWARPDEWVQLDLGATTTIRRVEVYLGDSKAGFAPPDCVLEASTDAVTWDEWASFGKPSHLALETLEFRHVPDSPVSTRHLRLRLTGSQDWRMAIRQFDVITSPATGGILMPRPAAWHGTWHWSEPTSMGLRDPLIWDEMPILAVGDEASPDEPAPAARAGYLQLHPAPPSTPRKADPDAR